MPRTISPAGYVRIARLALILVCVIVVTGASVRLSGSGLGCSDWPRCNEQKFIDVSTMHGAIEQANRLFTGLVAIAVAAAVLAARFRVPYRRDLVMMSWGLVAGVVAQVVLGGVVVLTGLHPLANLGHFALSMILVANGTILVLRANEPHPGERRAVVSERQHRLLAAVTVLGSVAVATGTIVTGTGPHAGDELAPRFGFDISAVARLHGISVTGTLVTCLALGVSLRRLPPRHRAVMSALEVVLAVGILQATIGYVQYFNGVPAVLVACHIIGATAFVLALTNLWLSRTQMDESLDTVDRNSSIVR